MTKRVGMAVVCGAVGAALVAGCSGQTPGTGIIRVESTSTSSAASSSPQADPATVIKQSLAAAQRAKTVQLGGSGTDSGSEIDIDLRYGSNGADGSVYMSGDRISLKYVGSVVYFQAPDSFLRKSAGADGTVLKKLSGKWIKASLTSTSGRQFAALGNRQALIASFARGFSDADAKNLKRTGTSSVSGVATTTYSDAAGQGTIDIASSGTPYPLKVVSKGSDGGTLIFSHWNEPYTVTPPPASQTVTLPG